MKFRIALAALAASVSLWTATGHAQQKLAFVDMQKLTSEIDEIKAAKGRLKAALDKKQKEIDQKQESLAKEIEALEKSKREGMMTDEVYASKIGELQKKMKAMQESFVSAQKSLMEQQQTVIQEFMGKVSGVIRGIAQEGGYSMVLGDQGFVLYAADSLDLTSEVIRKFNAKYPKK